MIEDYDDFDPDSVIGEDEQFAELDAFLMYLKELEEKPHVKMINPVRFQEFQYACGVITKAVKDENPDAKIEYGVDELFNSGYIRIETDEFTIADIKKFINVIKLVSSFEVHPLLNGNIHMSIDFHSLMEGADLE